ncbi:MAG TPA: MATE family efflux transporter [Usitatibacter sp.]|nr:MATE family efflux transporter [Usitatibacter sp.]
MKDLTQGPIGRHLVEMSIPIAVGMLLQTLYFLVDLYFVSRLGDAAIAGVSAAGNVMMVVFALTQMLGVGTVALMSHAVGRKDQAEAIHIFNQSIVLAVMCAAVTVGGGYGLAGWYMGTLGADAATREAGVSFLHAFIPGLGLQFALVVMGSALRGTGIVKPTMVVQMVTVLLNTVLAPVMIAGWGTGLPLGVAGAGWASTISVAAGVAVLSVYYVKLESYVSFDGAQLAPDVRTWGRLLNIGIPSGGEFLFMGLYSAIIYWIIRDFGAAAQAGFGIGSRILQAVFLPAMAVAFAAAPIGGQNFGARLPQRVRETFNVSAIACCSIMLALAVIVHWQGASMVRFFTADEQVVAFASEFLSVISFNFVAAGLVFTCSSLFQALGNTWPSLISMATRVLTFAIPAVWLSARPGFQIVDAWHLSVVTVIIQACLSYVLARLQMRERLGPLSVVPRVEGVAQAVAQQVE